MRWSRAQSNKRLKTQTSWRSFDIFVFFILKLNNSCANIYMQCAKLCYRLSSTKTIRTKTTFKYLLLVIVVLLTLLSCKFLQALLPLEKNQEFVMLSRCTHSQPHQHIHFVCVCVRFFHIPRELLCCYCRASGKFFSSASVHTCIYLKHRTLGSFIYLFYRFLGVSYMQMQIFINLVRLYIYA